MGAAWVVDGYGPRSSSRRTGMGGPGMTALRMRLHGGLALMVALLVMALLPAVAQAATIPIMAVAGTDGFSFSEGYGQLTDGSTDGGKWCVDFTNNQPAYVIMETTQADVPVTSYVLTTGGDNYSYPGRNPRSWTLYGSKSEVLPDRDDSSWTAIDSRTDDTTMKDENYASYTFNVSFNDQGFRYYKFEFTAVQNEDPYRSKVLQLGEIELQTDRDSLGTFGDVPST